MDDPKKQRVCMEFCFLLRRKEAETIRILRQDDDALRKSQVYGLFCFKSRNKLTVDTPQSGHPSTGRNDESIAKFKRVIEEDCRKIIDQVFEETKLSRSAFTKMLQPTQL
ncbi:mariner Mos1 transposase [Trichonephila clavipes]|nr:mariner Mos1 transposase [Trichonephila clavipes]